MLHRSSAIVLLVALSACAGRTPVVIAPSAPPPLPVAVAVAPSLPVGASPNMPVPLMRADGSFATPNAGLTPAATLWHMRAGLNVAALACRADEGTTVARYNALLAMHRAALTSAEARYAAEFRAQGGNWRDRYDDAMTRLYNYWSMVPARAGFCAAAAQTLADAAGVPADALPAFAAERLPALDRPFTDFYRAYDAWRRAAVPQMVIAAAASPTVARAEPRVAVDRTALFDERLASR
jgi:hypothetical protein